MRDNHRTNTMSLAPRLPALRFVLMMIGVFLSISGALSGLGLFFNRRRLPAAPVDAALVFGCGLAWKAHTRCATAAQVFHRGLARYLIVSGGVPVPGTDMVEAIWFREQLIQCGVPAERILLEPHATNTAENAAFALPIITAHRFTAIILVMSDFEGIRAHLTAKRAWRGQGITIYDYHAPSTGYWSPWTWWLTRTGWELTWYTLPRLFRYRLWPYLWARD